MKISKKDRRYLGEVAGKLVPTFYIANRKTYVKGIDLIEKGHTEIQGAKIIPDKTYIESVPYRFPVNHYRRLIREYQSHGIDGVKLYIKQLSELNPTNIKPINLGSRLI